MRAWWTSFLVGILATGASADEPQGKTVLDHWEAAYLEGGKAGFVHTAVVEVTFNGKKYYTTTVALHLTVKRFTETIQLRMDTGTTETAQGKVLGTHMRQYLGKGKMLEITGKVMGNELQLTLDKTKPLKTAPWDDQVVGLYRQQTLFKDKKIKAGDKFSYRSFEPSINLVVTMQVEVKDYEEIDVFGGRKKRLLRVQAKPGKVQNVQLPTISLWLDDTLTPVRSATDAPGLGKIVLFRTSKEQAMAPGQVATLTDIGISQYVSLHQKILNPYQARAAVYRITLKDDDDPASAFARDDRQNVKKVKGQSFELHVRSSQGPQGGENGEKVKDEFTQSSYFINCADPLVKKHAREAVGGEKDPWKKALRIEKWVYQHMKGANHEALAPADHVARTLQGDCTEYAMLTAAMCRAQGVPARTAVGLIYADVQKGPVFAFHMWTEVWVQGQWIPLDATRGRGFVGATHLKITDQSWHDERTLTPLLPVVRVVGRVSIEVVSAE